MTLRILAATDFSRPSQLAVAGAARLTAAAGARLDVVHVLHPRRSAPLALHRLDDVVASAIEDGADAWGHCVTGTPVATLDAVSRRLGADLVVLGARGSRGLLDQVLGTTAERLIDRLPCAALVVRRAAPTAYRTLLACVDTSPAAVEALRLAMALAPDARVHVLHAYEPPLSTTLRRFQLHTQAAAHLAASRTRARAEVEAALRDAGVDMQRVTLTLKAGGPLHVIKRAAARLAPDLVAVGHSTSSFAGLFFGSTARQVLRLDTCDVLVVRG